MPADPPVSASTSEDGHERIDEPRSVVIVIARRGRQQERHIQAARSLKE